MRRAEFLRDPQRRAALALWLAVAVFLGLAAIDVTHLSYNFDEGVYIFQARDMAAGKRPMQDFFSHQPPVYPAVLAALSPAGTATLWGARLLSALCWCAVAVMLFRLARSYLAVGAAALAGITLLLTPLGLGFGRAALPNALMVALSTSAFLLAHRSDKRRHVIAAGVLLTLAMLVKPLALATAAALALWFVFDGRWRALAILTITGVVSAACAWVLLDVGSEGGFTELVRLQLTRFHHAQGFDLLRQYAPFAQHIDSRGLDTALAWNLAEHRRALASFSLNRGADSNSVVVMAAAAALLLWPWLSATARRLVGLCLFWLAVPFTFNLLVWEPVWDHYMLQYIPPLALLAAVSIDALTRGVSRWGVPGLRGGSLLVVCALLAAMAWHVRVQLRMDPRAWAPLAPRGSLWLTLDPTLHLISDTVPACGVYDPFNVYGEKSLAAQPGFDGSRFAVGFGDLLRCLERQPEVRVFVTEWTAWFLNRDELAELVRRFPDRIVFQNPQVAREIRDRIERARP